MKKLDFYYFFHFQSSKHHHDDQEAERGKPCSYDVSQSHAFPKRNCYIFLLLDVIWKVSNVVVFYFFSFLLFLFLKASFYK